MARKWSIEKGRDLSYHSVVDIRVEWLCSSSGGALRLPPSLLASQRGLSRPFEDRVCACHGRFQKVEWQIQSLAATAAQAAEPQKQSRPV
jgi:hypothetical protein